MQIATNPRTVGEVLRHTREQLQDHRQLLLVVAVDGGCDRADHALVEVGLLGEFHDRLDIFLLDVHILELLVFEGDRNAVHVDIEQRGFLVAIRHLLDV